MTLGDLIHNERTRRGRDGGPLSQAGLAQKAGVSQQVISAWEIGASYPSFPALMRVVHVLSLDLSLVDDLPQLEKAS